MKAERRSDGFERVRAATILKDTAVMTTRSLSHVPWNNVLSPELHLLRSQATPSFPCDYSAEASILLSPLANASVRFVSPIELFFSEGSNIAPASGLFQDPSPREAASVQLQLLALPLASATSGHRPCACCSANVDRLTGVEDDSMKFAFCICCKQPLLASAFDVIPNEVFNRCRQCASKAPGQYDEIVKTLPVELHCARELVLALTAIHKVVQHHDQDGLNSSMFSGPRVREVEERQLHVQKARHDSVLQLLQQIRDSTSQKSAERGRQQYFAEWIATERECIMIVQREIVVLDQLLASRSIVRPPELLQCLQSLNLMPAASPSIVCPAAVSFECSACSTDLGNEPLEPIADNDDPAFCDCCMRMLPSTQMTTSLVTKPRITVCLRCHDERNSSTGAVKKLSERPDSCWIKQLTSVTRRLEGLMDEPDSACDLPYSPKDLQFQVAKLITARTRERRRRLQVQQHTALRDGNLGVLRMREFYSLEMEVQAALQGALTAFVRVMMQTVRVEDVEALSATEKASIRRVYGDEANIPSRVQGALSPALPSASAPATQDHVRSSTRRPLTPPVPVSHRCDNCKASAPRDPTFSKSTPAFCDCCRCVWPQEQLKDKDNMRFCEACFRASSKDRRRTSPSLSGMLRPEAARLAKLIAYVAELRMTLADANSEFGSVQAALPDVLHVSAEQEAAVWQKREDKLKARLQKLMSQPICNDGERPLYAEQLEIDRGLFESLTELLQVLVETVILRRLELTEEQNRLVAVLRCGDESIWLKQKTDTSAKQDEERQVEVTATQRRTDSSRRKRYSSSRSRSRGRDRRRETNRLDHRSRSRERRKSDSDRSSRAKDERPAKRTRT